MSIAYDLKNIQSFEAVCFEIFYMTTVGYGSIKFYTKKFSFCYYVDRSFVQQDRRFCKMFTLITEVHEDCFAQCLHTVA